MILRQEENEDGGPCLTALAAFSSLDSSMMASSEEEGAISCGGVYSTVGAILFYFLGGKKIVMNRRMLCHPRDPLVGDKARDFTIAPS